MTELEQLRARALKQCPLIQGSYESNFVQKMAGIADRTPKLFLSANQRGFLVKLCWRFQESLRTNGFGHVVPAENPYPQNETEGQKGNDN